MFLTTGPLLIQDVAAAVTDVTISILAVGAVVLIALIVRLGEATTRPVKKPLQRRSSGPLTSSRTAIKTNPEFI